MVVDWQVFYQWVPRDGWSDNDDMSEDLVIVIFWYSALVRYVQRRFAFGLTLKKSRTTGASCDR
jgi:hypothetical protein